MRTTSFLQLAAFSVILALTLGGCSSGAPVLSDFSDSGGIIEVPGGAPIQIAVAVDPVAPGGQDTLRGARLALEDYGRIYRTEVQIVTIEASCSRESGETAAADIVGQANIAAVVGLSCSEACIGAVPVLDANHNSVVSPTCNANQLTDQIAHLDAFLRTTWANTSEAEIAAEFIFYELASRRALIVRSDDIDSMDLASAFEATFTSLGGTILSIETLSAGGATGIASTASELDYDVVFAPVKADLAAELTTAFEESGESNVPFVGIHDIWNSQFLAEAGSPLLYATGPTFDESSALEDIFGRYVDTYSSEPVGYTYLFAYDAMWMVLDAVTDSVIANRAGTLQIGRARLNDALYATTNQEGLSGNVTCSQWGDCGNTAIGVGQARDGVWSTVYVP